MVRPVAARQPSIRWGRYWIFFSLRLTMRTRPSRSAAAKLAMARLSSYQMPSGEVGQFGGQVDVEVIPAPDQRGGQLTVGGDDQVPVVAPGEPLGLALAPAVDAQLVEQVRPVAGPVARHAGDADPPAARAAHPHDGPGSAPRPGASLRRGPSLAGPVLQADRGAQGARRGVMSGRARR